MHSNVQQFFAKLTEKAASDLEKAYLDLPLNKRDWCPGGSTRTANDQIAECAILNKHTAVLLTDASKYDFDYAGFTSMKTNLAANPAELLEQLKKNSAAVADAIRNLPDEKLADEFTFPWGAMTMEQIMTYPHWNMSYHEGQINYIATLVG
jgi:hypothetical protein